MDLKTNLFKKEETNQTAALAELQHSVFQTMYNDGVSLQESLAVHKEDFIEHGITNIEKLFEEANELAKRDRENQIDGTNHSYSEYFRMRQQQFQLLREMLNLIDEVPEKEKVNDKLSIFIDKLGEAVHTDDTARAFLEELNTLKENFKQVELPKTYQDFEAKSVFFQLLQVIERYLKLKINLMKPEDE